LAAFKEYQDYDALGLAALIADREVAATEVLEAAIAAIERLNPPINAIIHTMYDEARAAIRAGLPHGPLAGVPYALKDVGLMYAGVPTRGGSRLFEDFVPDHDSTLVERLRRGGILILGKTNTPEFALTAATEPRLFGPTQNPWKAGFSCGGSSGGSAAAVAARMLPAAHAGDGGGSIRVPAAHCALVGFKPTRARNPSGPDLGEGWAGVSVDHAVTRSVRDTAALLDLTHGPAPGDPYCAPPPDRPFLEEVSLEPERLRIAVMLDAPNGVPVDAECVTAARNAAKLCGDLGHDVEEATLRFDFEAMVWAYRVVVSSNIHNVIETRLKQLGRQMRPDDLEPITRVRAAEHRRFTGADYARATQVFHAIGRRMGAFFERYDVLLSPTSAGPPLPLGVIRMDGEDADAFDEELFAHAPFTAHFNCSGTPAISLPLHWSDARLPIGVHFGARFGEDGMLLRLAGQIERARPWQARRPSIQRSRPGY
jgi:Asp-tRNA(Asn)/Glu-tRNA(Gln) amidotransferase A subunit family amidase